MPPEKVLLELRSGSEYVASVHNADDYRARTYILPLLTGPESRDRLVVEHRANLKGRGANGGKAAIEHRLDFSQ